MNDEKITVVATKITQTSEDSDQHIGYWVKGVLAKLIKEGESLVIWRDERNGVNVPGIFRTSPVEKIIFLDPWRLVIRTKNSTWLVEDC